MPYSPSSDQAKTIKEALLNQNHIYDVDASPVKTQSGTHTLGAAGQAGITIDVEKILKIKKPAQTTIDGVAEIIDGMVSGFGGTVVRLPAEGIDIRDHAVHVHKEAKGHGHYQNGLLVTFDSREAAEIFQSSNKGQASAPRPGPAALAKAVEEAHTSQVLAMKQLLLDTSFHAVHGGKKGSAGILINDPLTRLGDMAEGFDKDTLLQAMQEIVGKDAKIEFMSRNELGINKGMIRPVSKEGRAPTALLVTFPAMAEAKALKTRLRTELANQSHVDCLEIDSDVAGVGM